MAHPPFCYYSHKTPKPFKFDTRLDADLLLSQHMCKGKYRLRVEGYVAFYCVCGGDTYGQGCRVMP